MLWGKKALRISAALAVAIAAAHTAESLKGQDAEQSLVLVAVQSAEAAPSNAENSATNSVPVSASLSSAPGDALGDLIGITSVAATTSAAEGDHCVPSMQLTAVAGAMIHLSLAAPCNRSERIVVRHSGLSFATKTRADGVAAILLPALKPDATVAVYLADARLVLGSVAVPEVTDFARYAIMWEWPAEVELRVTDGEKVLIGTAPRIGQDDQRVISLGSPDVQLPLMARVYSVPGKGFGQAKLTGELRITPASCGRTLRLETVQSAGGVTKAEERAVAVPLCGTAGDILLLKNLAPALTLAAPK
ncbi:MAG: hypothetical protein ACK47C_13305 [Paracoccaceae bacterium]